MSKKKIDPEQAIQDAMQVLRADYYGDVRDLATDILEHLKELVKDGETGEDLRESLYTYLHETIDGSAWVIYTAQAQRVLMFSDNDGAYAENYGEEGIVEDGCINWSRLAYSALEEDVKEQFEAIGGDWNDPAECEAIQEEKLAEELRIREIVLPFSRERIVKLLNSVSIDCQDDETQESLREALVVNVVDGTIKEADLAGD